MGWIVMLIYLAGLSVILVFTLGLPGLGVAALGVLVYIFASEARKESTEEKRDRDHPDHHHPAHGGRS
jgi:hypothetical protein